MASTVRANGGSPPDPTVRTRVLETFIDQVEQHGLPNVSIEQVARQAGVSKVTLSKRWPTRRDLVVDAYRLVARDAPDLDDFATLDEAIDDVFARADDSPRYRRFRQLTAELVAVAEYDEVARQLLFQRQAMWRAFISEAIELGKSTGEVPVDRDTEVLANLFLSVTTAGYLIRDRTTADLKALVWRILTADRPL